MLRMEASEGVTGLACNPFPAVNSLSIYVRDVEENSYAAFLVTTLVSVVKYMATAPMRRAIRQSIKDFW